MAEKNQNSRAHWLGPDLRCLGCGKLLEDIKRERKDIRLPLECSGVLYCSGQKYRED